MPFDLIFNATFPGGGGGGYSLALIRALKTDLTLTGRQSTAPLKVPGTDSLPSGASYNASSGDISVTGQEVVFEDWDFRGVSMTVNPGAIIAKITQCLFDGQRGFYCMHFNASTRVREVSWNSFDGGDGEAKLWLRGNVMPDLIEHNHCINGWDDYIKPGNNTYTTPIIQHNYFGPCKHWPNQKAAWSSSTTYNTGDVAQSGGTNYVSNTDGNINNPVTNTTHWRSVDPHGDAIQWYSSVDNNMTIRWNYFDYVCTDYNAGITSVVFLDSGGALGNGDIHIYENIIDMEDQTTAGGEVPQSIRVAAGGTGEAFLYHNYMRTGFAHLNNYGDTNLGTNWEFDGTNTKGVVIAASDGDVINSGTIIDYTGLEGAEGANWSGY